MDDLRRRGVLRLCDYYARGLYTAEAIVSQILFFAARSGGDPAGPSNCEQPFQCPQCMAPWTFGLPQCDGCGNKMNYLGGDTLDAIAFTDAERIIREKLNAQA